MSLVINPGDFVFVDMPGYKRFGLALTSKDSSGWFLLFCLPEKKIVDWYSGWPYLKAIGIDENRE